MCRFVGPCLLVSPQQRRFAVLVICCLTISCFALLLFLMPLVLHTVFVIIRDPFLRITSLTMHIIDVM